MNYNYRFTSLFSKFIASAIVFLGFSCSIENTEDEPVPSMYGCPTGKFTVKGKVTSYDGKEIKDAILRVSLPERNSFPYAIVEEKSNENGNFVIENRNIPHEKLKVVCISPDETLVSDSTIIKMEYVNSAGDKGMWYSGEAETTVNFVLKKKSDK